MPRNIRINTSLGPDVLLFEQMAVHDALGTPFTFRATVLSTQSDVDLFSLLGQKATVEVDLPRGGTRYFNGHVTSFSHAGTAGDYARYELTMRPWFWLLTLGTDCRIFQHKKATDIAKQIWGEHGFTDVREALSGSYEPLEYSVQYRESSFNYISRLLEHEGIYYFFEHSDGKHTLVLGDSPAAHKVAPGYDTVPYFPPANSDRRAKDHLSHWTVGRQMRPGAYSSTDYDFTRPKADLTAKLKMPAPHSLGDFEVFDYPGNYATSAEGENKARVRLEEHQAHQQLVSASGNVMGLPVGALFKMTDYPREDQNQPYLVVAASYQLETNPYASGGSGETEMRGTYSFIPAVQPYRVPASTPRPRVEGPQTATVVGKSGEEIWTDKFGRVKLQFRWDREGKSDENSSCWIRVSQGWAGSRWGSVAIPRIGQEVIVDFLEGDPDRPIVTGRVYNGDNMPPYDLPANQTQSGLKSRSSKGGSPDNFNEIRFEDKKGAELFYVQAEKDQTALVKHDQTTTVKNNKTVTVEKKYNLIVNDTYDIKVGPGVHFNAVKDGKLSISALQEIKVDCGAATITLKLDGSVDIKGTQIKIAGLSISLAALNVSLGG